MSGDNIFTDGATERELSSLKVFPYKDFYVYTNELPCQNSTEDGDLCKVNSSPFVDTIEPVYWYTITPKLFDGTPSNKEISFTTPAGYDFLYHTYLEMRIPKVKLESGLSGKYQICWGPDFCYHITPSAKIKVGGMILCTIDRYWMIFHSQYFSDANHKFSTDRDCGNTSDMLNWSEELPAKKLRPSQPWYYGRAEKWAFPLHRLNSQISLTHIYTVNSDISKLLMMRERTSDGNWRVMEKVNLNYLEITDRKGNPVKHIGQIRMKGELAEITPVEKELIHDDIKMFTIEDIIVNGKGDTFGFEQPAEIDLKTTNGLTKATYWAAQNMKAVAHNNYSNFTTNWVDRDGGSNPLRKISLTYDSYPKFDDLDADDFSGPLARKHFPSTPTVPGLHAHAYSCKMKALNDVSINAKDLSPILTCQFKKKKHIDLEHVDTKFTMIARSQVTKFIQFENGMVSFVTPMSK